MRIKSYIDNFDVSIESFDFAQIVDIVEILDTIGRIINLPQIRFYRDDGLIFIRKSNGPKT